MLGNIVQGSGDCAVAATDIYNDGARSINARPRKAIYKVPDVEGIEVGVSYEPEFWSAIAS